MKSRALAEKQMRDFFAGGGSLDLVVMAGRRELARRSVPASADTWRLAGLTAANAGDLLIGPTAAGKADAVEVRQGSLVGYVAGLAKARDLEDGDLLSLGAGNLVFEEIL